MPLSAFQNRKLARMFAVLDMDEDGAIERSDFLYRVDALADRRGWGRQSPEYLRHRQLAEEEWESLCQSADVDADDRVTLSEFLRFGEVFLDDREAVRAWAWGDARLAFESMDADGDGRLTFDEYREYLELIGIDASAAGEFWDYADLDRDGHLATEEMAHAIQEFFLSDDPAAAGNYLYGRLG